MKQMIPLQQLPSGRHARIGQLVGPAEEVHRLTEMGLRQGERIQMVRSGPTCIVRLCGSKLCFRDCDAFCVMVEPEVGEPGVFAAYPEVA